MTEFRILFGLNMTHNHKVYLLSNNSQNDTEGISAFERDVIVRKISILETKDRQICFLKVLSPGGTPIRA